MPFERILVPVDFSVHSKEATKTAIHLATAFGSSVRLIHAYHFDLPPTYLPGNAVAFVNPQEILEPIRENAEVAMKNLVSELSGTGVHVEGHVILGRASEVILQQIDGWPADAVVMGTRGLTGVKHVLLGSTAERVVRMAPCPVITVKANEEENLHASPAIAETR